MTLEYCPRSMKKCYSSKGRATQATKTIRNSSKERMHAYMCEDCRYWHIGHGRADGDGPRKRIKQPLDRLIDPD